MSDARTPENTLFCDTECYHGFWFVAFTRQSDGKTRSFELSDRSTIDRDLLRNIMLQNWIITYNGQGYDVPLIFYAINGATTAQLKQASDRIINGKVRYWQIEDLLRVEMPDFYIPRSLRHIDLIEPQPNAFASLKTLNGRLHGKRMQDLPIEPSARLTHADMDHLIDYCVNSDIPATRRVFDALEEPLALRETLSEMYGIDLRSKSDAQMGEGIIKKRVEQITGERARIVETPPGTSFRYPVPDYMKFETPELRDLVDRLRETDFYVKDDGKVDMPPFLAKKSITITHAEIEIDGDGNVYELTPVRRNAGLPIDGMTYAMGIGGLHSTEKNRAVHSDDDHVLLDFDVAFYYPSIIINSGLYPRSLGRPFLDAFGTIKSDRIAAKRRAKDILKTLAAADATQIAGLQAELIREQAKDKGGKIQGNGCFGKLGSRYSVLYAPHLLITVTITGQLAILMLIDRARCAGIPAVSANTDGVVFRCPRDREEELREITAQWERDTGFELESTEYRSLYSQSVNTYIAVKPDGTVKRKGVLANPRTESPPDIRTQLMINPSMNVCADAVVEYITKGTPLEQTIRERSDIRDFVTVVNVKGGGTWRGEYLGKVVRYIWAKGGTEIYYKDPHPTTGNFKKVSKTEGCRPVMDLPDELPDDIDYDRYVAEANEILMNIGAHERPPEIRPLRFFKYNVLLWWALAA